MTRSQLEALVKRGESERLEFKSSTGSISSGMQTVCAFLNSDHGGTIIFGVKDNGHIIGQEVTDKTLKEMAVELNKIEPHVKIIIEYVKVAPIDKPLFCSLIQEKMHHTRTMVGHLFAISLQRCEWQKKNTCIYITTIIQHCGKI